MTFKRMMALGAVAAALTFTGCQDRSRSEQDLRTREQTQPATGGSGTVDSAIPGSSNTIGGTRQDDRPGTELGGTGATGGSGSVNDVGGMDNDAVRPQGGDLDHGGSGTVHQPGTGDSLDQSGTGGSGSDLDQNNLDRNNFDQNNLDQRNLDQRNLDQRNLDQRNQLDDQNNIGGSDDAAR